MGEDAIGEADHLRPELVLMDVRLRASSMASAAEVIHDRFDVPVVYLTAWLREPVCAPRDDALRLPGEAVRRPAARATDRDRLFTHQMERISRMRERDVTRPGVLGSRRWRQGLRDLHAR